MPEVKNIFVGAKMNKDLNPRMISSKEYIDARNAAVINSEGSDSGLLQNVSGNTELTNFNLAGVNLEVIGFHIDTTNNRIFAFITNWNDSSSDQLSNFASSSSKHYICVFDTNTNLGTILVAGHFLNFSKTHPILGISLLEDLLFFTDNRNQPRKINVSRALGDINYYNKEEHISVAKYYPWSPMRMTQLTGDGDLFPLTNLTLSANAGSLVGPTITGTVGVTAGFTTSGSGSGAELEITIDNDVVASVIVSENNTGSGFKVGDTIIIDKSVFGLQATNDVEIVLYRENFNQVSSMKDVTSKNLPITEQLTVSSVISDTQFQYSESPIPQEWLGATITVMTGLTDKISVENEIKITNISGTTITHDSFVGIDINDIVTVGANPDYDVSFSGDVDYLSDKFARFSYRFKYDDGEYSLTAPFSQIAFIPKQDGYFLEDSVPTDINDDAANSDENKAIKSTIIDFFENKVNSIGLFIEMPEGVSNVSELSSELKVDEIEILYKQSDLNSIKVIETIKTSDLNLNTDSEYLYQYTSQSPIKVLPSNETTRASDKVPIRAKSQEIAGNRVIYGNYLVRTSRPSSLPFAVTSSEKYQVGEDSSVSELEYPNHALKQNRSYKVGIVLVDKFGRQSDVINSNLSTIYTPYNAKSSTFIDGISDKKSIYRGESLKTTFTGVIPSDINKTGYAGLYSESNPTGWYSYKVVVQQKEQEYYNVYLPSVLNNTPQTSAPLKIESSTGTYSVGSYTGTVGSTPGWNTTSSFGLNLILQVIIDGSGGVLSLKILDGGNGRYEVGDQITISSNNLGGSGPSLVLEFDEQSISNNTAFITLFSDNINKVPRDLKEVGPQDIQFSSSAELYPRVINTTYSRNNSSNQQFETSPSPDKAILIGTRDEIGLNKTASGQDYLISPFYSIPKAYVSQDTSADPIIPEVLNLGSNPYIAKISTIKSVGGNGGAPSLPVSFEQLRLNVYETAPVESNLDIFYETSSSGLISELNKSIISNQGNNFPSLIKDWTFTLSEATTPLSYVSDVWFDVTNIFGSSLTDINGANISIELINVFTLEPTPTSTNIIDITNRNLFAVEQNLVPGTEQYKFKLRTTAGTYFTFDDSSLFDRYSFVFKVTVNSGLEVFVNNIEIPFNVNGIINELTNKPPTVLSAALDPNGESLFNIISNEWPTEKVNVQVPESTFFNLYEFDSANGTANPDVNEYKKGVLWSVNKVEFYWENQGVWREYNPGVPVSQYLRFINNTTIVNEQLQFSKALRSINPDGINDIQIYGYTSRQNTKFRVSVTIKDLVGYGALGYGFPGPNNNQFYVNFTMKSDLP